MRRDRRRRQPVLDDLAGRQQRRRVHRQHADAVERHRAARIAGGAEREVPHARRRGAASLKRSPATRSGDSDRHAPIVAPSAATQDPGMVDRAHAWRRIVRTHDRPPHPRGDPRAASKRRSTPATSTRSSSSTRPDATLDRPARRDARQRPRRDPRRGGADRSRSRPRARIEVVGEARGRRARPHPRPLGVVAGRRRAVDVRPRDDRLPPPAGRAAG